MTGQELRALWAVLEDQYVAGLNPTAELVILDIDSTDDPTHGAKQLAFFHGFYDQHMFHPLLVFDGESGQLISAILRPGRAHASWGADGLLRRLIGKVRRRCPHATIVVRGDSGFAMPWLLDRLTSSMRVLAMSAMSSGSRGIHASSPSRRPRWRRRPPTIEPPTSTFADSLG